MTIEISEENNDNVEFSGIIGPNDRDSKLGFESVVAVAEDEMPDDSYVYVEKENGDEGEGRVYGENTGRNLLADCSEEQIEIVALEGVAGDYVISNSDDKGVEVKEIECCLRSIAVSGPIKGGVKFNYDNAVHNGSEIDSAVTGNADNGVSVSDGRVSEADPVSHYEPNAEDISGVQLDETERDSPVFVNHGTESNDENTDSNSCETAESESTVFVNHGDILNVDVLGLNLVERRELEFPEPTKNTIVFGSEMADADSHDRLEFQKEKMNEPLSSTHGGVDGDHHASDGAVMNSPKGKPEDVQNAESGFPHSDGRAENGEEKMGHSFCLNNDEDLDTTLYDAPQIENLTSGNKLQQPLSVEDAEDADFSGLVENLQFTFPANHEGGSDPCPVYMVYELPVQLAESVHEIQQLHAEGSTPNAEAAYSTRQVDEREQMDPSRSLNRDDSRDTYSNNMMNEQPETKFEESVDDIHHLQVAVQNAGGDLDSRDQADEENEKMEPAKVFNHNEPGHPCSDDILSKVAESFDEIQQLHANGIGQTGETSVDGVKITESIIEDDLSGSHSECEDLNVNGGMTRTKEIDSPILGFSNGASEAETQDGDLVMDGRENIDKDTVTVLVSCVVEDGTGSKMPKDMVEGKDEIENNGADSVQGVIHRPRVGYINETPEAPPTENMEVAKALEVIDVSDVLQTHPVENGVEKVTLQNFHVVDNLEFSESLEVTSNLENPIGNFGTVQAEREPTFNDGIAVETTKANVMEDVDLTGDNCERVIAMCSDSIDNATEISEKIQLNESSNFSDVNSEPCSLSELDEQHQPLSFESSKQVVPVSLPKNSPADDYSLAIDKDAFVNSKEAENGTVISPTGFQLREAVHVNGVSHFNAEFPLVFGSFQVITTNGVSPHILEESNASSAPSQLEDAVHTNETVFNGEDSSCSASSSSLDKEVTSSFSAFDEKRVDAEVGRKTVHAIVRVPRPIDNNMKEQIRQAHVRVDELTEKRDAINALVQKKQAARREIIERLRSARAELKVVKDAELAKRKQMDSIQSVLNKMKTATSVEEHDEKILSIQHRLEHETVPLKEEKLLIREINQLKRVRDKLSLDMMDQSDLQEAFDHKEEIEGNLKIIEKEFSTLRKELTQTDAHIKSIEKERSDLDKDIAHLHSQVYSANNVRQEAYLNLKNLKQQEYDRNNAFYQNKRDIQMAHEFARAKDMAALEQHCINQRERMMELWNKNAEFRKEYIKNNEVSILRRFGALDGRHLGPDEKPPVLRRHHVNVASTPRQPRPMEKDATLAVSTTELLVECKPVAEEKAEPKVHAEKLIQKIPPPRAKKTDKLTVTESTPSASGREEEAKQEEKKPSEVELQRLREEEERRKEEEAMVLKEKRRQEEMAKAKEAEERKRRNAEKPKARAEARAQKVCEEKQKEREKRARKKAVAAAAFIPDGGVEFESVSSPNLADPQTIPTPNTEIKGINESPAATTKRPANARSYLLSKTSKQKSMAPPLPLRKNRRTMRPWIYGGVVGSLVILLMVLAVQRFYF